MHSTSSFAFAKEEQLCIAAFFVEEKRLRKSAPFFDIIEKVLLVLVCIVNSLITRLGSTSVTYCFPSSLLFSYN